jgi:hypothetical protein
LPHADFGEDIEAKAKAVRDVFDPIKVIDGLLYSKGIFLCSRAQRSQCVALGR